VNRIQGRKKRRWNISSILTGSFILLITLPIFLVTTYSVRSFNSILIENATSRAMQTVEQVSYTVEGQLNLMKNTVATIANDSQVIEYASLTRHSDGSQQLLETRRQLESKLYSYFHYTPDLVSVMFFYNDSGMAIYKQELNVEDSELRKMTWYQEVLSDKNKVYIMGAEASGAVFPDGGNFITAAIAPSFSSAFYNVEMIYFVFHARKIADLLHTNATDAGPSFVVDPYGSVVVSSETEVMSKGIGGLSYLQRAWKEGESHYVQEINGQESFIIHTLSDWGRHYIQVYSYDRMLKQVNDVYRKLILASALGLVVFLLVSYLIVRSIVKPIGSLINQMASVKAGNLKAKIEASGPVEIYVLGTTFNEMIGQLKDLIRQIEQKENQKRLAEISALQSQINPHFLLNTLNTIKLMASISKASNIQKMTEALTRLLSAAFNRGGMYSTVAEEMKLLDYYIQIMKIRYGDQFDVEFDIDPRMEKLPILKLLLQPIVENAIVHGVHERETRGLIQIAGRIEDDKSCRFTVRDNGRGIQPEVLSKMLEDGAEQGREGFSGIGLRNVNDRLRLNYGLSYGLHIESKLEDGTTISVLMPILQEES